MLKIKDPPRLLTLGALFIGGFFSAGAHISGIPLPCGACWIAALCAPRDGTRPLPERSELFAWFGIALSALLWQTTSGLYNMVTGLLILTVSHAFGGSRFTASRRWQNINALLCGGITALLFLLSEGISLRGAIAFLLQLLLLPIGTTAAAKAMAQPKGLPLYLCLFALISGASVIPLPGGITVGAILAADVVFSLCGTPLSLPMAALAGLALDWSGGGDASAVTALAAAGLASGAAAQLTESRPLCLLAFAGGTALSLLLSGGGGGELFLTALAGSLFASLLPPLPVTEDGALLLAQKRQERLHFAAEALSRLAEELPDCPVQEPRAEISEVYDRAAAQVCARCARFSACWRQERELTHAVFSAAAPAIESRGYCVRADLPEPFVSSCRHFSALRKAINAELDAAARRRQQANRRRELRLVLRGQYRILADYLRTLPRAPRESDCRFEAASYVCSLPREDGLCGDLTRELRRGTRYYFLLCDGMGTGIDAAADSGRAAELLLSLLRAEMEPDDALELLNGVAILREEGGFSTVDLLCADLHSGDAVLYKCGGAPSYLRRGAELKKIGTASFPPGLGVGGTQQAQRIRLSLGRGEVLILTSDGIGGEDAERLCRSVGEETLAGLAGQLAASGSREEADDRTAAVVRLSPIR